MIGFFPFLLLMMVSLFALQSPHQLPKTLAALALTSAFIYNMLSV